MKTISEGERLWQFLQCHHGNRKHIWDILKGEERAPFLGIGGEGGEIEGRRKGRCTDPPPSPHLKRWGLAIVPMQISATLTQRCVCVFRRPNRRQMKSEISFLAASG